MKTNLSNWLSAICAILLIVLLVLQTKQKSELETLRQEHQSFASATEQRQQEAHDAVSKLADQVATLGTNLESRLVQGEQQANEKMGATMNMVQQNTAVMHRALGKVIPVELPEALTNQLTALEARIADENSWPKDATNADAMVAELRDLIRQIPPWAEEDYLPRLNALRWGVQSLQLRQANADAQGEDLDAAADAYANQLSTKPDDGSTNIAAVLTSRQQDATAGYMAFRLDSAIKEARNQLSLPAMTDGFAAWQRLAEWTNNPSVGKSVTELVAELRQQLQSRLLDYEIAKYSDTTKIELGKLDGVTNNALRQAGYLRSLENVTVQRLRLLQEADAPPSTINALADLSVTIETRIKAESNKQRQGEAGRERGYQQWALEQISYFRAEFGAAIQRTKPGKVYGANPDPDFNGVRSAMVNHLLQISPGYLDTAVAMIYRQAFDDGMNKLDGNLQLSVANQDAKMPKKTPQNYLENQP